MIGEGNRQIKSFADTTKTQLASSGGAVASLKSHWVAISGAILSAYGAYKQFTSVINEIKALGSETYKLQKATGLSAEEASELLAVADQMGVSYEALSRTIILLARRMGGVRDIENDVIDETGKAVNVFEKFGIAIKDKVTGAALPLAEVMTQIRDRIRAAGDESEKLRVLAQFTPRGAAMEMMSFFTLTEEGYRKIAEESKKYGIILTQTNVNAVRQYIMVHRDLDDAIQGVKLTLGKELLPVLTQSARSLGENTAAINRFVNENRTLLTLPWGLLKEAKDNFALIGTTIAILAALRFGPIIVGWVGALLTIPAAAGGASIAIGVLATALTYLLGLKIGEDFDRLMYWLSGGRIDVSGLNALRESEKSTAEMASFLAGRQEEVNKKLATLGFIGPTAMKDFNDTVKSGLLIYDQATGSWKKMVKAMGGLDPKQIQAIDEMKKKVEELAIKLQEMVDPAGAAQRAIELFWNEAVKKTGKTATPEMLDLLNKLKIKMIEVSETEDFKKWAEETGKAMDSFREKTESMAIDLTKVVDPIKAAGDEFNYAIYQLVKGIKVAGMDMSSWKWEDVLGYWISDPLLGGFIKNLKNAYVNIQEAQGKQKILQTEIQRLESENAEQTQTNLTILDAAYDQAAITMEQYFSQKRAILQESTQSSIEILKSERAEIEKWSASKENTAKLMENETKIRAIQQEAQRQGIQLNSDETKNLKELEKSKADWASKLAEAKGDWEGVWSAQIKSLEADRQIALATRGVDDETRKLINDYHDLKDAEAEAYKNLDFLKLAEVGMKEFGMTSRRELADTFKNFFPDTIKSVSSSLWQPITDGLKGELKTAKEYFKSFCDSLIDIWSNVFKKMAEQKLTDLVTPKEKGKETGENIFSKIGFFIGLGKKKIETGSVAGAVATAPEIPFSPDEFAPLTDTFKGLDTELKKKPSDIEGMTGALTNADISLGSITETFLSLGDDTTEFCSSLSSNFGDMFGEIGSGMGEFAGILGDEFSGLFEELGSFSTEGGGGEGAGWVGLIADLFSFFDKGGQVTTGSGAKDDVSARLTRGEYVLQKKAVDYYGPSVAQALNEGLIPKSVFFNGPFRSPSSPDFLFATGGLVSGGGMGSEGGSRSKVEIDIDVSMDKYLIADITKKSRLTDDEVDIIVTKKYKRGGYIRDTLKGK
jgi:hypothetical protein